MSQKLVLTKVPLTITTANTVAVWNFPYTEQARVQASDAAASDFFGQSIALSSDGNTLAIGAFVDDNSGGTDAGSVYVFTRSGSTWTEQTRLQASDAAASDRFGFSIAFSSDGNTLAIGANLDNNTGGLDAGSVYVFTRSGSTWTQQTRLQASDAAASDWFGWSVALSSDGNTLAIGAYADDNTGGANAGSVYVFTRSDSTWTEQTRLQAGDAAVTDQFGWSVALSSDGNTLAIGANFDDNTGGTDAGSVYVFTRSGSTWTQQTRLQASDAAASDRFGHSVALSSDGNTLAIGAHVDDNTGGTDAGSVYVFTRSGSTWTQQTRLQASDALANDNFGYSVALSSDGNTLAIGAVVDDNSGGSDAGSVYVFTRSGSTWTQQGRLQASDAAASDQFGSSVALSSDSNTLAIGAAYDDNTGGANAGSTYIFTKQLTSQTGLGIGISPSSIAAQLHLSTDSALKLTTTTWQTGSDQRVKLNIDSADTARCYQDIKSIPLRRFQWDSNFYPSVPDRHMLGWVAQEVQTVVPKAVKQVPMHGYSDFHVLDTDQLLKITYGALQHLIGKYEETNQSLQNLTLKYEELEGKLNS